MDKATIQQIVDTIQGGAPITYTTDRGGEAGAEFAIVPSGYEVKDLSPLHAANEKTLPRPYRKRVKLKFVETASLIEYVNVHSDAGSVVFANRTAAEFEAILDYHEKSADGARWLEHQAKLTLQRTREWNVFKGKNGQQQAQQVFAEFLEDQARWIVDPSAARLLEIALAFEQTSNLSFKSVLRLDDGASQLNYSDERTAKNVEIPKQFTFSLSPFEDSPAQTITARLRYRAAEGEVKFFYQIIDLDAVERQAVDEAVERIEKGTSLSVLFGSL